MADFRFETELPFSDAEIGEIEKVVGRSLPEAYSAFVKQYGGAFVGGLVDGVEDLPILSFFSASGDSGVIANLNRYSDLKEDRVLPIAGCALGNLYVLDRDNEVYYINYYGGQTSARKVSDTFEGFVERIVVPQE